MARRSGTSLVELIISVTVTSLIAGGIHACLVAATNSVADNRSLSATALQATQILDQLAAELETAVFVSERSATSIRFSVPDRNSDGLTEQIRYEWTGTPGGALTRQYNGGTVSNLLTPDLFSVTPAFETIGETVPGICTEDAAESLLIDRNGTSGTGDNTTTPSDWFGQYFTLTLPADVYAWRPTRVDFMVKRDNSSSSLAPQLRDASASLMPESTVLSQSATVNSSTLSTNYAWRQSLFPDLDPHVSGAGFCFVAKSDSGLKPGILQRSSVASGMLKTSNTGSSWDYDTGKALVSRLYGKLFRAVGTQTVNSNYLTSMTVQIRDSAGSPTLHSTVAMLNHPELLSNRWELKFDRNPTLVDANGDGTGDWFVNGGGTFSAAWLVNGVWLSAGKQLTSSTPCNFNNRTVVDLRFQNTTVGGSGAFLSFNTLRAGSQCVPLKVSLSKGANGTQLLKVTAKTNDATSRTLLRLPGLPPKPILLQLIVHPSTSSVSITLDGVRLGTYVVTRFSSNDAGQLVTFGSDVSTSEFSYVRLRVMEE